MIEEPTETEHEGAPMQQFFIHAPKFEWYAQIAQGADDAARQAVEHVAKDLYQFGLHTEEELRQHGGRLVVAGQQVEQLRLGAQELRSTVEPLVGQVAELATKGDTMLASAQDLASRVDQFEARWTRQSHTMEADIGQVQEELQEIRLEGRRRRTVLESNMVSQGEEYTQILQTEVKKSEQKLTEAMEELKKEMHHWVQQTIHKELSVVWKSIGDLERDCSQIPLLHKKATDLAEQQDRLMRMVEEVSA